MAHDPDWFEPDKAKSPGDAALGRRLRTERIEHGNNRLFYMRADWRRTKQRVLAKFRHACVDHDKMEPKMYRRAMVVHHRLHVADYPEYALSEFVWGTDGKLHRNLVPVCGTCHSARHGRQDLTPIAERLAYLEAKAKKRKEDYERRAAAREKSCVTSERW